MPVREASPACRDTRYCASLPTLFQPYPALSAIFHKDFVMGTQMDFARQGVVTEEMQFVAAREDLDAELVRAEVARGRMVIPANKVHLSKRLQAMATGVASKCKINANIGNSAVTSKIDEELEKLH